MLLLLLAYLTSDFCSDEYLSGVYTLDREHGRMIHVQKSSDGAIMK